MGFSTHYETDQYVAYLDLVVTAKLSFAVKLTDDLTKNETIGSIKVKVKETDKKAMKNTSGYYLFTDLKPGEYTVSIEPDLYFSQEITVDISSFPDQKNPISEIILIPRPVYPFSQNATLIRGVVRDAAKAPVKGAHMRVIGRDMETISDENGSFVFYLSGIENEEEVIIESKKNGNTRTINIAAKEFQTVSAGVISLP
ncbi:hypothetical protein [uncultured Methanomethylovorans sp.]|uniref:hypothetical protein n=1 Tax=uncultured Methanomethylovorans sp. TaxID=183759 RepID=UPI00261DEBC4|nr:hypothetical protein [uncultured Methanomethylovorans sp.]